MANQSKKAAQHNLETDETVSMKPEALKEEISMSKVGHFITVNTAQIKGTRINLDKIRTYAKSDEKVIQIAWDNGMSTILQYRTEEDADATVALLDKYCL